MTLAQITDAAQAAKKISELAEKNLAKLTEYRSGWSYKYTFVDAILSTDEVGQPHVNLLWADAVPFQDDGIIIEPIHIERFMEICEAPITTPTVTQLVHKVSGAKQELLEAIQALPHDTLIDRLDVDGLGELEIESVHVTTSDKPIVNLSVYFGDWDTLASFTYENL